MAKQRKYAMHAYARKRNAIIISLSVFWLNYMHDVTKQKLINLLIRNNSKTPN